MISNWAEVYEVFKNYFLKIDIEKNILMQILVVIEEIFTNIVYYSGLNSSEKISIKCEVTNNILKVTFIDTGKPFDITKMRINDHKKIGGFGINIVKKIMDEISYNNTNGHNKITLTKKLK